MDQEGLKRFIAGYRFMPADIHAGFTALARGHTLPQLTLERLRRYCQDRGRQHVLNAVKDLSAVDLRRLEKTP